MAMKYKVFVDTNQLFNKKGPLNEPFNLEIPELQKFLKDNKVQDKVTVCIPEIVVRERIQTKLGDIEGHLKQANESIVALQVLGHKNKGIKPLKKYKKELEDRAEAYIRDNKVQRVKTPDIDKDGLIERAVQKMKPFNDNGAGFKDTLIYLSIVEDALSNSAADRYIFCTNDSKEFTEEIITEFAEKTGKELYLVESTVKVREKLDELIPLRLHLRTRNESIRSAIMSHLGDIMERVNKTLPQNSYNPYQVTSAYLSAARYATSWNMFDDDPENIAGYNYSESNLISIDEIRPGKYGVHLNLTTEVKYKNDSQTTGSPYASMDITSVSIYGSLRARSGTGIKFFDVQLEVSPDTGLVSISSIR